jgi:NAD(P)-dependent dehydrogenase (short-subunit alcohol dehydrogenase family)
MTATSSNTIVVTGANTGIGKSVALQLAQSGHHVVAVCRDPAKGKEAMEEIRRAAGSNARVDFVQGDLSSVKSVRDLATRLLTQYHAIHVLINNAGCG